MPFSCGPKKSVALPESGTEETQEDYMRHFVAHKMTRNNTLNINKVHVAETELSQLLSQNTNVFGQATA